MRQGSPVVKEATPNPASGVRPASPALHRLGNIQVLRAFAAGSVALLHAALLVETKFGDHGWIQVVCVALGAYGVPVFFAISGFLMVQVVRGTDPATFLLHRVLRIYPLFLLATAIFRPLIPLVGAVLLPFDPLVLTLAPVGTRSYVLGVEWTLLHEMVFYLGLFLIASAGWSRHIEVIAAAWIVAILANSFLDLGFRASSLRLDQILLAEVNLSFAAGLLLPWLLARGLLPARLCLLLLGLGIAPVWADVPWLNVALALAASAAVAAAVQLPQITGRGAWGKGIVLLGDWSYVLYLVHMSVMFIIIEAWPVGLPRWTVYLGSLAGALAVTALLGPLDVALYRRSRRLCRDVRTTPLRLAAWLFALGFLGLSGTVSADLWRIDRGEDLARTALRRLPADSLSDEAALRNAIAASGLRAPDTVVAGFDRTEVMANGYVVVTAWGTDLARPGSGAHLALICGGRQVALARQLRYRPDIAARLGRSDLRKHRIGFTAAVPPDACPIARTLLPVLVDGEGRLMALDPITRPRPGTP